MHRLVQVLPTAAERIAMMPDAAIFCLAFHTINRDLELSVVAVPQIVQMAGREGLLFKFLLGKTLTSSSQAVVV